MRDRNTEIMFEAVSIAASSPIWRGPIECLAERPVLGFRFFRREPPEPPPSSLFKTNDRITAIGPQVVLDDKLRIITGCA